MNKNIFKNLKSDFPASIVVFLVALPLCLGIALASGAPLYAGIIAGIVGGIVVGAMSGSSLGVSGPAAGLAVIVLNAIQDLGSFEIFLVAVVVAGVLQIIMGIARMGIIAYYFPNSVIHGMLAGIGILIFLKQIPHALGYDKDFEGDESFFQPDNQNTFSEIVNAIQFNSPSIILITVIALIVLLLWQSKFISKIKFLAAIPGPLLAVVIGISMSVFYSKNPELIIDPEHLVSLPVAGNFDEFIGNFRFPDFSAITNPQVLLTAAIIAIVASLETLLCVEATDKLDPDKNITPTNKELIAQGAGNIVSGLIGGLPVTQVIVRSSANIQSGGKTKMASIIHGVLLLISIIAIPNLLNLIPKATLAAILLIVGYKLAKPVLFKKMWAQGLGQFLPFVITILGIVFTDLLTGIGMGLAVAIFVILYNNFKIPFSLEVDEDAEKMDVKIVLSESVTFLNKASLLKTFDKIPDDSKVTIDASKTYFMHQDVLEIIEDFKIHAESTNIDLNVIDLYVHKEENPNTNFKILKK